ncbi:GNAT family acetyltransferase [Paenibacillus riograndensis]|uniref:GNAT family acetyltransferase n=1 Tax=Paenibacillus riograndensis TaxID=483937 RepID=A0A132U7L5_9BACL|nr:GNAT family N-acetyltransferase [Paenibacillus riograndensis]KWX79323.1 GNAT family acetyltransferase [Paenibacillus riograndensis]
MNIRLIEYKDNSSIEHIIRECLIEFGGNREGLAWADASMHDLYHYYKEPNRAYWIVEEDGKVLGGCGIAPFAESDQVCELQKMYLSKSIRGSGIAAELLQTALDFAALHYKQCYLETLQSMHAANRFYRKNGFTLLESPLGGSEHFACDAWYIKSLEH